MNVENLTLKCSNAFLFLALSYLAIFLTSVLLINKRIILFDMHVSVSSFIVPLGFTMSDIITEIYGYKISRKIVWNTLIIQGFFCLITASLIKIQPSLSPASQADFNFIFSPLPRIFLSGVVAVPVSILLNTYILSKWKILLKGKYFWLRGIGSSIVGEVLYTSICVLIIYTGILKFELILQLIISSCIIKLIFASILSFPANIIVNLLKKHEKTDVFDYKINYNPFKT